MLEECLKITFSAFNIPQIYDKIKLDQLMITAYKCVILTFKDTCYLWGKNSKNPQLLDILACNSANNPSFWNLTKSLSAQCSLDVKMQLDVGSEPYLSTAQALCLIISNNFYYKSFANGQIITAMAKSER